MMKFSQFERDISAVINKHCVENESNTPDFILAHYVRMCLDAFVNASRWREKWYGKSLSIGEVRLIPSSAHLRLIPPSLGCPWSPTRLEQ